MSEVELGPEPCDRCGKEALGFLGDEQLCEDCLHGESSCCGNAEG